MIAEIDLEIQLLARAYSMILEWPDNETAGPEHFGEGQEPAEDGEQPITAAHNAILPREGATP